MKIILLKTTLILFLLSNLSFSQNHPGKAGEDAPGGETVKIKSSDIEMHGVLYRPNSSIAMKLPAIITIHGWEPYNIRGGEANTYFAKEISEKGFITLGITLRGWKDTGGTDDCGLKQSTDIINAVKWLSKQPGVDPERIGLLGQSLGGQIALTAAAKDNSIKAVVAYFPVTDFKLWGETTNHGQEMLDDYIYVLFMHGDQDKNVIIDHSMLMYLKMLKQNKDVELYIAKSGGHGSYGPAWENHFNYMIDYFRNKLK